MATKTTVAHEVARAVSNGNEKPLHDTVAQLLEKATGHSKTLSRLAREAAVIAVEYHGKEYARILSLYKDHLKEKAVKSVFSSAVAVLCYGQSIVIRAKAITRTGRNQLTFSAPKIMTEDDAKSIAVDDGEVQEALTPNEIINKCNDAVLKSCASLAREEMGVAKKGDKGGRPRKENSTPVDPVEAIIPAIKDKALRAKINEKLREVGYVIVPINQV